MKIAINSNIIDKATSATLSANNGTFVNSDITATQLAHHIQQGYAFCAQHKNKWRTKSNFTSAEFLAVDVDHGLTLQTALDDEFVKNYACIVYTTINHTEEFNRFRIVFELDVAITESVKMNNAFSGLIQRFGGDVSCKDACRIFYGSTTSNPIIFGNKLPEYEVINLITRAAETRITLTSIDGKNERSTTRSGLPLPKDIQVRIENGTIHKLSELPPRTRIYCPRHSDNNPSAFTLRSKQDSPGVYCSACAATYFMDDSNDFNTYNSKPYDFDYNWKNILNISLEEFEYYQSEMGVPTLNDIRGGDIIPLSERYLQCQNPDIWRESMNLVEDSDGNLLAHRVINPDARKLHIPYHLNFVKSPKGSGKTEWLTSLVNDYKSAECSILLIGHRRSLITASAKRLNLTCYLHESSCDDDAPKREYNPATPHYAICVDSMINLLNTKTQKYDLILIDEAEQVFSHLISDTMKENRREILHTLKYFINKASSIYLLDADLGRTSIEILDALLDHSGKYQAIVNTWTPLNKTVKMYPNKNNLIGELLLSLERGERCFVCSNSKAKIDQLYSEIGLKFSSSKNLLCITSENSQRPDIQKLLQNIKTRALDFDAIFVSPAIGTGIDITFENDSRCIDSVFGIFEARINTHFDIDQQLSRVRNPKQTHVYISPEEFNFETDENAIRAELNSSNSNHRIFLGLNPDGSKIFHQDELYERVFSSVVAKERASKNQLLRNFRDLKFHNGWSIIDIEPDNETTRIGKQLSDSGKARLVQISDLALLNAEAIGPDRYDEYLLKNNTGKKLTKEETFSMRRFELESFYYEKISQELIDLHNNGKFKSSIKNFELLNMSEKDLRSKDINDNSSMFPDKHSYLEQKNLFHSLLISAGLMKPDMQLDSSKKLELLELDNFASLCLSQKSKIERLFKIPVRKDVCRNPTQQLNSILKLLGLSLIKPKTKSLNGDKRYIYILDADKLDLIQRVANRRADIALKEVWNKTLKSRDISFFIEPTSESSAETISKYYDLFKLAA